ncbi:UDP-N-acetylmuramoyl-L-alanine--D-glutamate ligase [Francisella tularensis]|uniref:UDP-N-acetylmuramoylalanine--D-glutamate ligase n=1 Tax=Francisella tularensis subsp. mediasiatica (strain FSC147) TaxID=441952 RepID=MURD_FRATM|nr:UDP-N-acetylmuramoyl-L-alanine--D-glutamate ligase [Francisella tularensis]B2SDR8.1 RecName: Full=UDP-N-acetylmuramoylalanine--D-glutamate ligase; AltName: Full=D-glutamic acid-adding enzyme; AltName: Full=UDP-N-acetylmuramoyl-L-alanyl-D-glutamate synthetase [Francisella tularensis subsp. mediasiatica FSC147]ACD31282.1 UDP-N-acetylmuramoylalanine--D-glutamate ligase [Francisella tularensis subsp. mediasiatica FSC147]MBK2077925.1 UDP-N-acetylmuramoyl-L-alanine--D-glutamate ligase [Francisella 
MFSFYFNDNKITKLLMVGYGSTGKSVCDFLANFIDITVDISQNDDEFVNYDLNSYDLITVSPGIPLNKSPYRALTKFKDKIVSDIDIFYQYIKDTKAKTIAVTGSNGKSTVVTMTDFVLKDLGYKSILVGNIGTPALNKIGEKFDYCVVEVSSFQINLFNCVRFDLGCIINVSPDHLDRYQNFEQYKQSKLNLAKFSNDFFVYDVHNGIKYAGEYQIIRGAIYRNSTKLLDIVETKLFGEHNLENIIVVLNILDRLGLDINQAIDSIKKFKGLEHRCKIIKKVNGTTYINDSKGTNVGATIAALNSITNSKNIILLLGGVAKGGDFSLMIKSLDKYVKYVYIYGVDKEYIESYIKGYCKYQLCNNMKQAFELASQKANSNEIVLLSPACASFDEFSGYAQRGEVFQNLVAQLEQKS